MDSPTEQGPSQPQAQLENADAFEHIKQGSDSYDAQTYGRCREACPLLTELCEGLCCVTVCPAGIIINLF